jgi:hypothetical protein
MQLVSDLCRLLSQLNVALVLARMLIYPHLMLAWFPSLL